MRERQSRPPELVVVSPLNDFTCSVCGEERGGWLIMEDGEPVCMGASIWTISCSCRAAMPRLPGERRRTAVCRRWWCGSAVAARFERQGILVEEPALERAEQECLADEEARARRRERDAQRRAEQDLGFAARMAEAIVRVFPGCSVARADAIARHASVRGSGRVGRSAAGRALDPEAIELAVAAAVRHEDTRYDELLMSGLDRETARARVRDEVARVLRSWRG